MKIKCIEDRGFDNLLTIGKTYDVIKVQSDGDYVIIDDLGSENWYYKEDFKPLSEIRNDTINKLLE